jgi:hypothetical protein
VTDRSLDAVLTIGVMVRGVLDRTVVPVDRFLALARGALVLHFVNRDLYARLRDLEGLASSWSGSAGRHPVIRRARESLTAYRADGGVDPFIRAVVRDLADR